MVETTAPPARGRRRMTAGLAALAWCAVVAVAATAAWVVVDRVGGSLLGGSGPGLTSAGAGLPTSSATSAAASSGASSLSTAGGRVAASCTPTGGIALTFAIPADTWGVEVNERGPARLRVEFKRGSQRVEVTGTCRAGLAVLTPGAGHGSSGQNSPAPASSSSSSDDHGGNRTGGGSRGDDGGGSPGGGSGGGSGTSGSHNG